jgi:Polyketide cyclase / dehydrase and lipid transport
VNNLNNWNSFSPWAKLDTDAATKIDGPAGEGAKFTWNGNHNIGEGAMTIIESDPSELVKFKLDFKRPFEDTATVDFTFHPDDEGTFVTWTMYGDNNFFAKIMSVVMDCDAMIGDFFEEGLENLNKVVKK